MKTPFHYNVNRTLAQEVERTERNHRWEATGVYVALLAFIVFICWLLERWL